MMEDLALTLDIDWAPDAAIDLVADTLIARQVKATWFVTHRSAAVDRLRTRPDLFELGIHPNFLPRSTHGGSVSEVLDHVMALVPDAVSMRSHAVVQSGPILAEVVARTPVRTDSSIFLPEMPNIRPVKHLTPHGTLVRVPFFWADDYEMLKPSSEWTLSSLAPGPGVKVFMFHPIHLYLNAVSFDDYAQLKDGFPSIRDATEKQMWSFVRTGRGARALFQDLVSHMADSGSHGLMRDFGSMG